MSEARKLDPAALYTSCDPSGFDFNSTDDLPDLDEVLGQPRATEAIRFGIGIERSGFNLFAVGSPGTGRRSVIDAYLKERAASEPTPPDFCYAYNFAEPHKPNALKLPAGRGAELRKQMDQLVEDSGIAIPAAFESDDYRARRKELEDELQREHARPFDELRARAEQRSIALIRTPQGMALAPVRDGEVLSTEQFKELPDEEKKRVRADLRDLESELEKIVHQLPNLIRQARRRIQELDRNITRGTVASLMEDLRREFDDLPEVIEYFDEIEKDAVGHASDFRTTDDEQEVIFPGLSRGRDKSFLRNYTVNLLVHNTPDSGAPVVYEDNPTFQNIIGRVEHIAQMGTLLTNFSLIKPGALHRANGGYLMLDVRRLVLQPFAWEGLKRALMSGELQPESPGAAYSLVSTVSLEPEPVELSVKVILLGDRFLYYLLYFHDPDFPRLFKVMADFEETMDRGDEENRLYARLIATLARKESLLPLDREACARIVEEGSRIASDAERMSIRWQDLADLMREADYWAREEVRGLITYGDIQKAVDARTYRSNRLQERLQKEIMRGTILIDTAGERVGQVNGLSVYALGGFMFGHPSRITARVRLGKGKLVDIQREVDLGGPLHSKGVLILSAYLGARYAPEIPLSLSASLVFEQSYGPVEGDSASAAELYALLSALAGKPLKQSIAVTGSVNQHGDIQAIGGANEKIEGFFDICLSRGLDGSQGVLIPAANVKHLMLRADVVEAVEQGRFHVWSHETVDAGLSLLTGTPAGERDEKNRFPEGSINALVEARLVQMADQAKAFSTSNAVKASGETGGGNA